MNKLQAMVQYGNHHKVNKIIDGNEYISNENSKKMLMNGITSYISFL